MHIKKFVALICLLTFLCSCLCACFEHRDSDAAGTTTEKKEEQSASSTEKENSETKEDSEQSTEEETSETKEETEQSTEEENGKTEENTEESSETEDEDSKENVNESTETEVELTAIDIKTIGGAVIVGEIGMDEEGWAQSRWVYFNKKIKINDNEYRFEETKLCLFYCGQTFEMKLWY